MEIATVICMSGKNNINPGQYKVAGRDKPDDQARERMKGAKTQSSKKAPPQQRAKAKNAKGR